MTFVPSTNSAAGIAQVVADEIGVLQRTDRRGVVWQFGGRDVVLIGQPIVDPDNDAVVVFDFEDQAVQRSEVGHRESPA